MGDLGPELSPEEVLAPLSAADLIETNEEIHVLVTGFGVRSSAALPAAKRDS